jgi:hypothetical protein
MFEELDLWIGEVMGFVTHATLSSGCTAGCPTGKACNVQTESACKGEPTQKCDPSVSAVVVDCVDPN